MGVVVGVGGGVEFRPYLLCGGGVINENLHTPKITLL